MTKGEISEKFKQLEKFGCFVSTANSHKKMPSGLIGFPDHVILTTSGEVVFIEVKLGKDKYSKRQELFESFIKIACKYNDKVYYFTIKDGAEALSIYNNIIKGTVWTV